MNTLLIKHINDTQKKMGAYLSLLDLRFKNLCVKADPVALLPVTVNTGHQELNLEDVANVSMPNEYQLAIFPNIPNYMQDIIRGVFEAHPEFKLEIRDTNEDRKNQENSQKEEPDKEKLDNEEPDMNSVLGLDDIFDEDSDETKYLLYTMPEVNKDRRDFLNNGVKALHQQCMVRLDGEYAAGLKKFSEVEMYSSEKDMAEARQDLKDILDDVKEKANQKLQEKQQEIEEAYRHYLEKTENPVPNNPQEKEQDQLDYDVTKGFRVS